MPRILKEEEVLNLASTAYDYWKKVYKWARKQGKQHCLGVEDEQARLTDNFYRQRIVVRGAETRGQSQGQGAGATGTSVVGR